MTEDIICLIIAGIGAIATTPFVWKVTKRFALPIFKRLDSWEERLEELTFVGILLAMCELVGIIIILKGICDKDIFCIVVGVALFFGGKAKQYFKKKPQTSEVILENVNSFREIVPIVKETTSSEQVKNTSTEVPSSTEELPKNTDSSDLPEQETSKTKEPSALFMLVGVVCLIIGAVAALAECFGITLFCILFFVCALVCEIK